jgi:hypothetical protein
MTRRQIGLSICAVGIVGFFLALFGHFRDLSPFVAGVSVLALIIGLVVTTFSLKGESLRSPHLVVIVVTVLAFALHLYENLYLRAGEFSIGFILWPITPFVLCLVISCFRGTHLAAIAGSVVALCFDLLAHYQVFIHPTSSTAGLALLFAPLWNTLVFSPIAIFIAWLVLRKRAVTSQTAP